MANQVSVDLIINGIEKNTLAINSLTNSLNTLNKSSTTTQQNLKSTESLFQKMNGVVSGVTDSLFSLKSVILTVFAGFSVKEIVSEAMAAESSINNLNVALASSGIYSSKTSADFQDFAASIQETTKYSDDAVMSVVTLGAQLTSLGASQLKQATQASLDLSSALKIDLETAAGLVFKSIEGNSGALGRYGIQVAKGRNETENFSNTLKALSRFQGQAEASANTFEGALAKASNQFGELKETLGSYIVQSPLFVSSINKASQVFVSFNKYIKENSASINQFISSSISSMIKAFGMLIEYTGEAALGFKALTNAVIGFFSLLGSGGSYFLSFITTIISGFTELLSLVSGVLPDAIKNKLDPAVQGLNDTVKEFRDGTAQMGKDLAGFGLDQFEKSIENIQESNPFKTLGQDIVLAGESLAELKTKTTEFINQPGKKDILDPDAMKRALENIQELRNRLGGDEEQAKLKTQLDKDLKLITDSLQSRYIKTIEAEELTLAARGEYALKSKELQEKRDKEYWNEFRDRVEEATRQPFIILFKSETKSFVADVIGSAKGFASMIKEGATGLIKGVATTIGSAFGPLGQSIAGLFTAFIDLFAQAPETFQKMIVSFITDIPKILGNIFKNLAFLFSGEFVIQVIKGLVENIPYMVQSYIEMYVSMITNPTYIMKIAGALIEGIIKLVPNIGQAFINGFKNIFKSFGSNIFEGFKDFIEKWNPVSLLSKLFKFDSGGKGAVEKFLGFDFPFVKFAKGGLVGGVFSSGGDSKSTDNVPAMLSIGEIVLPKSAINKGLGGIIKFLDEMGVVPKFGFGGFVGSIFQGAVSAVSGGISAVNEFVTDPVGTITRPDEWVQRRYEDALAIYMQVTEQLMPPYIKELFRSLLKIGAKVDILDMIRNPVRAVTDAVKGVTETFIKPPLKNIIKKPVGLEIGGMVPNGFSNDSFPAMLSSKEYVLDRSITKKLDDFLNNTSSKVQDVLLARVINLLESPVTVNSEIKLDQRSFANILLEMNRTNSRTSL